jgi:hypothetical protein
MLLISKIIFYFFKFFLNLVKSNYLVLFDQKKNKQIVLPLTKPQRKCIDKIFLKEQPIFHRTPFGAIFILAKKKIILRISRNSRRIEQNFYGLRIAHRLHPLCVPQPLIFYKAPNLAISAELKLEGKAATKTVLNSEVKHALENIHIIHTKTLLFKKTSKQYLRKMASSAFVPNPIRRETNLIFKKFLLKISNKNISTSFIHGDLTFRNIYKNGNMFDFEYSQIGLPVFDLLQFYSDLKTHQSKNISYRLWFDNIFLLIKKTKDFEAFLKKNKMNKNIYHIDREIILSFAFFSLCNTIGHYYVSYGARHSIKLLKYIENHLDSA